MRYFDYEQVAQEASISAEQLFLICRLLRHEYPDDDVLYELHVLRACNSVKEGRIGIEALLKPIPAEALRV